MKMFFCYEDKGPTGICGATVLSYTIPKKRLIIVEGTYDEIKEKIEQLESSFTTNGRISPKLTHYYFEGNDDECDEFGFDNQTIYL